MITVSNYDQQHSRSNNFNYGGPLNYAIHRSSFCFRSEELQNVTRNAQIGAIPRECGSIAAVAIELSQSWSWPTIDLSFPLSRIYDTFPAAKVEANVAGTT